MARNVLSAKSGQQSEHGSASGPGSYPTGGFSVETKLGRVNEASAEIDDGTYDARVASTNENYIVVEAYSQTTDSEVDAGVDLSSASVSYSGYRL